MSLTNEWFEFHLTPDGWVEGSKKEDFRGETNVAIPPSRVMTIRCREYQSCSFAKTDYSREQTWRSPDGAAVRALIDKYGVCPKNYLHWPERT